MPTSGISDELATAAKGLDTLLPARKWGLPDRDGVLTTSLAAAGSQPDVYTYDPADPAPSVGGHSCCGALTGPQRLYDQSPVEQRSDVLVYSSDALQADTEMTRPITVDLWATSTARGCLKRRVIPTNHRSQAKAAVAGSATSNYLYAVPIELRLTPESLAFITAEQIGRQHRFAYGWRHARSHAV